MTELAIATEEVVPFTPLNDDQISAATAALVEHGLTASTEIKYDGDWSRFVEWCASVRRGALPATPATLAEYVGYLAGEGRAPSTIKRALSSISVKHRRAGHKPPDPEGAQKALRGYRKGRADKGLANNKQARVVHVPDLRRISDALRSAGDEAPRKYAFPPRCLREQAQRERAEAARVARSRVRATRDRAVILASWAGMKRRDEMADLWIHDIEFFEGRGMTIHVRHSKTDQNAEGYFAAVKYASEPALCPVLAMQEWIDLLASREITDGRLFRRIDWSGRVAGTPGVPLSGEGDPDGRMTGKALWTIVTSAGRKAGLRDDIAPHGLRAGGATAAHAAGVPGLSIDRQGGWVEGSHTALGYRRELDLWEHNAMKGVL